MQIRPILAALGLAALVVLTSGCTSLTADLELDGQARASGSIEVSLNKQVASLAGISSAAAFESQLTGGESDIPAGALRVTESDTDYLATVTLRKSDLRESPFEAAVLPDGNVRFSYVNDGQEQADADEFLGDLDMGTVNLTVRFPGEVLEFGGLGAERIDARTVRWSFPITAGTTASATSEVASAGAPPILAGAVGVTAVIGAVGLGMAIRRRAASPGQTAATAPADASAGSTLAP